MSGVEALERVLSKALRHQVSRRVLTEQAERIIANPGPLLEALAEAGVLQRDERARIHYHYGVNSGTLTTANTQTATALAVRNHEQLTMGPIDVDRIDVATLYTHLTEWRPDARP